MDPLISELENVPQNFVIGRDDFGWWYSLNGGAAKFTSFGTMREAMEHYLSDRDGLIITRSDMFAPAENNSLSDLFGQAYEEFAQTDSESRRKDD